MIQFEVFIPYEKQLKAKFNHLDSGILRQKITILNVMPYDNDDP